MVKVLDTFSDDVVSAWRKLENAPGSSVFQTLDWCRASWESLLAQRDGNRLHLMFWSGLDEESPVIMPTFLDKHGTLRFINDEHSDCGDAVYERGYNNFFAFKELTEAIIADRRVRSICLQKIRRYSEALGYFSVFLRGPLVYRDHAYPWLEIPHAEDFSSGQRHLRSRDRNRIAYCQREAASARVTVYSVQTGTVFPEDQIVMLRDLMRRKGRRDAKFIDKTMLLFIRRVYECGLCEVLSVSDGDEVMSIAILLKYRKSVLCWLMLYQDTKWNTYLHVLCLDKLARAGGCAFDFGVGMYDYKLRPFRPKLECTFSLRWGRGFFSRFYAYLRMNWRFIRVYWGSREK